MKKTSKQMSASAGKGNPVCDKGVILRPQDLQTRGLPKDYQWRSTPETNGIRSRASFSAQSNRSHHIASCYDVAGGPMEIWMKRSRWSWKETACWPKMVPERKSGLKKSPFAPHEANRFNSTS